MYALEELGMFMSQLDLLGGAMFAMTEEGQLIAVSDDTPPFKTVPGSNDKLLIQASEMNNTVLSGAARWLERKNHTLKLLTEHSVYASNVKIAGSRYFVDTAAIKHPLMNMCLVVVTPRESIMHVVDKSSRSIAIFMSSVSLACLAVGVGLLLLLTKHMGNELRLKKELSQHLEAKERAEACTASARLFLANLSHDLRTPMAAIIGLLEIMSGNSLDTEQKGLMEQAQSNADTLHTLLNTVLDISKVEAGTLELECAPFDLQHELETIADLFYLEGMKKEVDVVLDLSQDLPIVIGDSFRVRQIFANLLSNSMRFTPMGYVLIRGSVLDQENATEVQLMGGSIRIIDKETPGTLFRFDIRLERQGQEGVVRGPLSHAESVCAAPALVPLLECGNAVLGVRHGHGFPDSHCVSVPTLERKDTTKCASVENIVSEDLLGSSRNVLLAMPRGSMRSKVAATWFERRGCNVTMASSWEGMRAAMEAIVERYVGQTRPRSELDLAKGNVDDNKKKAKNGGTLRCLVLIDVALIAEDRHEDLALHLLQSLREDIEGLERRLSPSPSDLYISTPPWISAALLITAATHPSWQREARSIGCTLLQKPLIPSRLTPLLRFFDSTGDPTDGDSTIPLTPLQEVAEIGSASPPHETHPAEFWHKDNDCVYTSPREDDTKCANEDERRRASRGIDVSTSPMRIQGTDVNGSVTGKRKQEEYLTADTQSDQLGKNPFPSSGMTPLLTFSNGAGHSTAKNIFTYSTSSEIAAGHTLREIYRSTDFHKDSCHPPETSSAEATAKEYVKSQRDPVMLNSPRLVQGTESVGEVTGQRQQLPQILTDVDATAGSVRGGTESVVTCVESDRFELKDSLRLRRESQVSVSEDIRWDGAEDVKKSTESVVVGVEGRGSDASEGSVCEDKKVVRQTSRLNGVEDFKGLRILLVEDTPVMAQIATKQMEKIGAKVRWAQDGQVAVEMFTEIYGGRRREADAGQSTKSFPGENRSLDDGFDVIVMDCQMPRLDGYGATSAIRELEKVIGIHTPIVALTAHAMTTDRKKCLDVGMDEYLAKPLNVALFKATLAKLLKPKDS